jgi:hypothetical protein
LWFNGSKNAFLSEWALKTNAGQGTSKRQAAGSSPAGVAIKNQLLLPEILELNRTWDSKEVIVGRLG